MSRNLYEALETAEQHKYGWLTKTALSKRVYDETPGFVRDVELSTSEVSVVYNASSRELVIAFRGTQENRDLVTIATLSYGGASISRRAREGEEAVKAASAKYDASSVTLTGHSLGGGLALYLGYKLDLPTYTYNPYMDLQSLVMDGDGRARHVIYRTPLDPVSVGPQFVERSDTDVVIVGNAPGKNPHKLGNFIALPVREETDGRLVVVREPVEETLARQLEDARIKVPSAWGSSPQGMREVRGSIKRRLRPMMRLWFALVIVVAAMVVTWRDLAKHSTR